MRIHHIHTLVIVAIMVGLTGCASRNKQSSPATSQNPDAGASFLRLIAAEDAKHPILPDDVLIAAFQKHRATFEQLQQMIATDSKLHRVDEDWTDPRDPRDAGISASRIAEYRQLLVEVGCSRGFEAFQGRSGIYFISAAQGTVVASQDQGYYYFEGTPDPVVTNTASYRAEQTSDSFRAYRHIDGHWYIYYARNWNAAYTDFAKIDVDAECESNYFRHHRLLYDFVTTGTGEQAHVAKAIRPFLEGFLHRRFPGLIPRGLMFGQVVNFINGAQPPHPTCSIKGWVGELNEINEYAGQFHHDTNPDKADTVAITPSELRTFSTRALDVVHKGI